MKPVEAESHTQPEPSAAVSHRPVSVPPEDTQAQQLPPPGRGRRNDLLVCPTDPDSTTVTRPGHGTHQAYRDHRLTDDRHGVILATVAASGDVDDAAMLSVLLDKQAAGVSTADLAEGEHRGRDVRHAAEL
jgi:hypothetical protein